jgi:hypothetical protein
MPENAWKSVVQQRLRLQPQLIEEHVFQRNEAAVVVKYF